MSVPIIANSSIPSPLGAADGSPGNLAFSGGTLRYTGPNASTDHGATLDSDGGTFEVSSSATTLT